MAQPAQPDGASTGAALASCPCCGAGLAPAVGWRRCRACGAAVLQEAFRPLLDAASLPAGEGRCARHPAKDATDACERCGAFVCDVCRTRTAERLLCPACFDRLHERAELGSTRTSRVRWDQLALVAALLLQCNPVIPFLLSPAAGVLALVGLVRWRRERWLEPGLLVAALLLVLAPAVLVTLAVLVAEAGP